MVPVSKAFPDPLQTTLIDGRKILLRPFSYITTDGELIIVPAGFETDLASVPRFLWWWLPPHGRYERAAVVHDWICYCRGCVPRHDEVSYRSYTSQEAADLFGAAMAVLGVWWPRRAIMVAAVKLAGPRF